MDNSTSSRSEEPCCLNRDSVFTEIGIPEDFFLMSAAELSSDSHLDPYTRNLVQEGLSLTNTFFSEMKNSSQVHGDGSALRNSVKIFADELHCLSWDRLHTGPWHRVPMIDRSLYALCCFIEALLYLDCCQNLIRSYMPQISSSVSSLTQPVEMGDIRELIDFYLQNSYHYVDMGLIMGGNETGVSSLCHRLVDALRSLEEDHTFISSAIRPPVQASNYLAPPCRVIATTVFPPVPIVIDMSLEKFICDYMEQGMPVIVKGYCKHWDAVSKWADFSYFRKVAGRRTVPVEIGSNYTAASWTQKLMTFNEFLSTYVENDSPPDKGYLAQHPIFEQIPVLEKDLMTPEFASCGITDTLIRMLWLGPAGTVSPLHTDPYQNIYIQLVGRKYVKLCHPSESANIYAFKDGLLTNTSSVNWDISQPLPDSCERRFPLFSKAQFVEAVVEAGDLLYIPRGWWHFVKSLDRSASVSYWFE
eukprot:GHVQ01004858.1.p1 GENE.GHVQ01004858.1~~GHVQ01004858.1.p1  ORF type:complete len:473 (-),score=31.97 GHVQ01004858.1:706-2124(-)